MDEHSELQLAITKLERQSDMLGDAAVKAALTFCGAALPRSHPPCIAE